MGIRRPDATGRRAAQRALAASLALGLACCASLPGASPPATAPAPQASVADPGTPPPIARPSPATSPGTRLTLPTDPVKIAARIAELEAARSAGKDADPDGTLALELALLYSHPDNAAPDHAKALAMIRARLALAPQERSDPVVGHVAALLEEIDRLGRVVRDSREREKELASQVKTLEQRLAEAGQREAAAKKREQELLAQIKTLQQQIDQLQKLDLEIERRRRSVK